MIINSQLGGKKPTGTKSITTNGVHDVADYASADVQVPTTAPDYYIAKSKSGTTLNVGSAILDLTGITDVGSNVLYAAYLKNSNITGTVDLSSITTLSSTDSLHSFCSGCNGVTAVDLSNLTTISGTQPLYEAFSQCYNLTTVDLTNLTSVTGSYAMAACFSTCSKLQNLSMPNLTTITGTSALGGAFRSTKLGTFVFEKLSTLDAANSLQRVFGYATITSISFPALTSTSFGSNTSQFNNMIQGVNGCTVHFPSNLQSVIGSWADVTSGFGGTNTTVLFDLPATA